MHCQLIRCRSRLARCIPRAEVERNEYLPLLNLTKLCRNSYASTARAYVNEVSLRNGELLCITGIELHERLRRSVLQPL
jgi:hypothetical protein